MAGAWDIKTDDSRGADGLTTYVVFCEDGVDEPVYFSGFQEGAAAIKINVVPNQRAGKLNLNSAMTYCVENGYVDYINGRIILKPNLPHNIWCVYDRDFENEDLALIKPGDDIAFTTAIQSAENAGLNVAWSNDIFELWILLHFEMPPLGNRLHRRTIYDRLTQLFKDLPDKSPELEALTASDHFDYKVHMKRKRNFIPHVHPILKERRAQAIANATELEALYAANVAYHDRNPCTMVHKLVQQILDSSS